MTTQRPKMPSADSDDALLDALHLAEDKRRELDIAVFTLLSVAISESTEERFSVGEVIRVLHDEKRPLLMRASRALRDNGRRRHCPRSRFAQKPVHCVEPRPASWMIAYRRPRPRTEVPTVIGIDKSDYSTESTGTFPRDALDDADVPVVRGAVASSEREATAPLDGHHLADIVPKSAPTLKYAAISAPTDSRSDIKIIVIAPVIIIVIATAIGAAWLYCI